MAIEPPREAPSMFWCCVYAVEHEQRLTLAYGYAVAANELGRPWGSSTVYGGNVWRLRRFTCFLAEADLQALGEHLLSGRIRITTQKDVIEIESPGLRPRSSTYAVPRTLISVGSPQSFSEELATVDGFWCVGKRALIEGLFPRTRFNPDETRDATQRLFHFLQAETGIKFEADEAGRFGNFEIVRYPSGDVRVADGLCCANSPQDGSLVVWVESPLAGPQKLTVNCRMFNGGGSMGRTCILDELRECAPGARLRFVPKESYGEFEVSVWRDGILVAHQHQSILRAVTSNLTIAGPQQRTITKWSQSFPEHLRARAETVAFDTKLRLRTKRQQDDMWPDAELEAEAIVGSWKANYEGRFFANAQMSTLDAVEFIATQIRQPGVISAMVADPFFDGIGVESLLTRLGDVKRVTVLTSQVTPDGVDELRKACERCRRVLPAKLAVINVESPGATTQQFHDRYVATVSEAAGGNQSPRIWMLSNSLSSFAKRYPLVVVPLAQGVAGEVMDYLESLKSGQLPDRADLRKSVVWTNDPEVASPKEQPAPPTSAGFPGWGLVLQALVPDVEHDAEREKNAISRGLLAGDFPDAKWRVPDASLPAVVGRLKEKLSTNLATQEPLLSALCHWAYHGGPAASDYAFGVRELQTIEEALAKHLIHCARTREVTFEFAPLDDAHPLPECLEQVGYLRNHPSRGGMTPELFFFAEALWHSMPNAVVEALDGARDFALFNWLTSEVDARDDEKVVTLLDSKLGAAQALGVLMLRDRSPSEVASASENSLARVAAALASSKIPPLERWLTVVSLSVLGSWRGELSFRATADLWLSRPLSGDERNRVGFVIDRAAPNRVIVAVSSLAAECPLPDDAAGFRSWCVDRFRARLPLKPSIPDVPELRIVSDDETVGAVADAVWNLYGDATATWFEGEIINKLDLWSALKPLLRTRDYSGWNAAMENVLVAVSLGMALAKTAQTRERRETFQKRVAPGIALLLLKLGPELWQHFPDFSGRLAAAVAFLGNCGDLLVDGSERVFQQILAAPSIPSLWKLRLILESPTLARKNAEQAVAMAAEPTTSSRCRRSLIEIEKEVNSVVAKANRLAASNPDLQQNITKIIHDLTRWQNGFNSTGS